MQVDTTLKPAPNPLGKNLIHTAALEATPSSYLHGLQAASAHQRSRLLLFSPDRHDGKLLVCWHRLVLKHSTTWWCCAKDPFNPCSMPDLNSGRRCQPARITTEQLLDGH
jgi:hypothetical protein